MQENLGSHGGGKGRKALEAGSEPRAALRVGCVEVPEAQRHAKHRGLGTRRQVEEGASRAARDGSSAWLASLLSPGPGPP